MQPGITRKIIAVQSKSDTRVEENKIEIKSCEHHQMALRLITGRSVVVCESRK